MCAENQLQTILSTVASQSKALFSEKLHSVILFGSYARGDFDSESDIDIMILADITDADINSFTKRLYEKIYHLELEYDCVLSICVVPNDRFNRFKNILPFYRNIDEEGVKIAV